MYIPFISFTFFCLSLGLNRENNVYLSEEKVKSVENDSLILKPTL